MNQSSFERKGREERKTTRDARRSHDPSLRRIVERLLDIGVQGPRVAPPDLHRIIVGLSREELAGGVEYETLDEVEVTGELVEEFCDAGEGQKEGKCKAARNVRKLCPDQIKTSLSSPDDAMYSS